MTTIAKQFFMLKERKEKIESELEDVKKLLEATEQTFILWLENNELSKVTDEEYGTAYLREEVYARVTDEAEAFKWFNENNYGGIIKETVHSKTLSATMKTFLQENKDLPPGVEAHVKTRIGMRRS